jgi:hypothetical protein
MPFALEPCCFRFPRHQRKCWLNTPFTVYKVSGFRPFHFKLPSCQIMAIMETTLIYSITLGAFFVLLILRLSIYHFTKAACPLLLELGNFPPIHAIVKFIYRLTSEHLIYPTTLRRGKYIDRWSRSDTLLLLAYFAINLSCILVPLPDIDQVCRRSGTLSVVNLLLVFAAPHLSFLVTLMSTSSCICRKCGLHACSLSCCFRGSFSGKTFLGKTARCIRVDSTAPRIQPARY